MGANKDKVIYIYAEHKACESKIRYILHYLEWQSKQLRDYKRCEKQSCLKVLLNTIQLVCQRGQKRYIHFFL